MGALIAAALGLAGVAFLAAGRRGLPRRGVRRRGVRRPRLTDQRDLVEAIATFVELLRDAVAASAGLEQALTVTVDSCPPALEPAVRRLVARLRYGRVDDALREFADEVAHPAADFVVAALLAAVQHHTKDLGSLLTHLAASTREECRLCMRVWVSRARTRTAVRIVSATLAGFVALLFLFSPAYLRAYASPSGLAVLGIVAAGFASGLVLLDRLARAPEQARLIRPRPA